jgi:predicted nucleotidyltransferase
MDTQTDEIKEKVLEILKKHYVKKAAFFGSIVRNELTEESDIDILIEFKGKKSLFDLANLQIDLEDSLQRKFDVLTYNSIHPLLRERILSEQEVIL